MSYYVWAIPYQSVTVFGTQGEESRALFPLIDFNWLYILLARKSRCPLVGWLSLPTHPPFLWDDLMPGCAMSCTYVQVPYCIRIHNRYKAFYISAAQDLVDAWHGAWHMAWHSMASMDGFSGILDFPIICPVAASGYRYNTCAYVRLLLYDGCLPLPYLALPCLALVLLPHLILTHKHHIDVGLVRSISPELYTCTTVNQSAPSNVHKCTWMGLFAIHFFLFSFDKPLDWKSGLEVRHGMALY